MKEFMERIFGDIEKNIIVALSLSLSIWVSITLVHNLKSAPVADMMAWHFSVALFIVSLLMVVVMFILLMDVFFNLTAITVLFLIESGKV